jgi:hypothetical protein
MPRYRATIPSRWDPARTFAYIADFSNAAEWDPGVVRASRVAGADSGRAAAFDLVIRSAGREMPLRYQVASLAGQKITFRAETERLESVDTITVVPAEHGSLVEYDARLSLRGLGRLLNPLLALSFHRIGERARRSLTHRLAGVAP